MQIAADINRKQIAGGYQKIFISVGEKTEP